MPPMTNLLMRTVTSDANCYRRIAKFCCLIILHVEINGE
jgi:hypothetical protein